MTRRSQAEADDDSRKCYTHGLGYIREIQFRRHAFTRGEARNDKERRWFDEGEVPMDQLETVREPIA